MLQLTPFTEGSPLVSVYLGPKGKWMVLDQIAKVVFNWDVTVFRRKIIFNQMTTGNTYKMMKNNDAKLLQQLRDISIVDKKAKHVYLISVPSLGLFIRSYSRRASLFTRLYDTVYQLQFGKNTLGTPKRKRTLTAADKKRVAASQSWTCAHCKQSLNARYEVDHIVQFAHGGTDDPSNLQALCSNCHAAKTDADLCKDRQSIRQDEMNFLAPLISSQMNSQRPLPRKPIINSRSLDGLQDALASFDNADDDISQENDDKLGEEIKESQKDESADYDIFDINTMYKSNDDSSLSINLFMDDDDLPDKNKPSDRSEKKDSFKDISDKDLEHLEDEVQKDFDAIMGESIDEDATQVDLIKPQDDVSMIDIPDEDEEQEEEDENLFVDEYQFNEDDDKNDGDYIADDDNTKKPASIPKPRKKPKKKTPKKIGVQGGKVTKKKKTPKKNPGIGFSAKGFFSPPSKNLSKKKIGNVVLTPRKLSKSDDNSDTSFGMQLRSSVDAK